VFYVDPPVVHHAGVDDSQIEDSRNASRQERAENDNLTSIIWRRAIASSRRAVAKRVAFRKLLRGEIGVTRWPPDSAASETDRANAPVLERPEQPRRNR